MIDEIEQRLAKGRAVIARLNQSWPLLPIGGKIPIPGASPVGTTDDNVPRYRVKDLGWCTQCCARIGSSEQHCGMTGAPAWEQPAVDAPVDRLVEITSLEHTPLGVMVRMSMPCESSGGLHPIQLVGDVEAADLTYLPQMKTPYRNGTWSLDGGEE